MRVNQVMTRIVALAKGEQVPSGLILTPDMVRGEIAPGGLITDPRQVREQDWPKGIELSK